MRKKITITYDFNTKDIEPVSKSEVEMLDEYAREMAFELMDSQIYESDLCCEVSGEMIHGSLKITIEDV
jgi:hypothetical protein